MLLPEESSGDYVMLVGLLQNELKPIGMLETELVGRIGDLVWRLRRASLIEAGVLTYSYFNRACTQAAVKLPSEGRSGMMFASEGKAVEEAETELATAIARRDKEVSMLGLAFIEDAENRNALM
jgi:hypothetical protein